MCQRHALRAGPSAVPRRGRRALLVASLVATLSASASAIAQEQPPTTGRSTDTSSAEWLDNLRGWLDAVARHQPGQADEPACYVDQWTLGELRGVLADLKALARLLGRADGRPVDYAGHRFTPAALQELLHLSDEEASRGDPSRLVKRGAVLHADSAILLQEERRHRAPEPPGAARPATLEIGDARYLGMRTRVAHWEFGRLLLDAVLPSPSADHTVRQWYVAGASYLLGSHDYANGIPHLERAQQLFGNDPDVLFLAGALNAILASPSVQNVTDSATLPPNIRLPIASKRVLLANAQHLFQRAVEVKPDFVEARVRLAHALTRLGREEVAAKALRVALATTTDPLLLYYANLFLGDAEQALERRAEAEACYRRASALFPRAQSPYLALAQLSRRHRDRAGAVAAISMVLTLPHDVTERDDPWWNYYFAFERDTQALLRELRKPFTTTTP